MSLSYCGYIVMFAWISNSIPRPPSKRAVALAFTNCFSQLGNIAGSYVWPKNWGPSYHNSYAICIATGGFSVLLLAVMKIHLERSNQKMDALAEGDVRKKTWRYLS